MVGRCKRNGDGKRRGSTNVGQLRGATLGTCVQEFAGRGGSVAVRIVCTSAKPEIDGACKVCHEGGVGGGAVGTIGCRECVVRRLIAQEIGVSEVKASATSNSAARALCSGVVEKSGPTL